MKKRDIKTTRTLTRNLLKTIHDHGIKRIRSSRSWTFLQIQFLNFWQNTIHFARNFNFVPFDWVGNRSKSIQRVFDVLCVGNGCWSRCQSLEREREIDWKREMCTSEGSILNECNHFSTYRRFLLFDVFSFEWTGEEASLELFLLSELDGGSAAFPFVT